MTVRFVLYGGACLCAVIALLHFDVVVGVVVWV